MHGLRLDHLRKRLGRSLFTTNIVFHETLNSTNSLGKELGAQGAPEGTVVLTEEQTAGRGRMGRRWFSPGYSNLLFSLLLRPPMQAEQVFVLTMALALAAIEGVEEVSGLRALIKWPNDLYIGDKKLGGILTEFEVTGKDVEYVVQGLGLNVNWNPVDDVSILYPTTSIMAETGCMASRTELLVRLLGRFEAYYSDVLSGQVEDVREKWNGRSLLLGKWVEIETTDGKICGRASRVDQFGALIIRGENGKEQRVLCGDVSVKKA